VQIVAPSCRDPRRSDMGHFFPSQNGNGRSGRTLSGEVFVMREFASVIIWITLGFTAAGACVLAMFTFTQAMRASLKRRRLQREALALAAIPNRKG
jgi:Flp pilus assembly protein TadB